MRPGYHQLRHQSLAAVVDHLLRDGRVRMRSAAKAAWSRCRGWWSAAPSYTCDTRRSSSPGTAARLCRCYLDRIRAAIIVPYLRLQSSHIPGHQRELGVLVSCAALVVERDPAREVESSVVLVDQRDVVGLPADAVGDVADLRVLLARAVASQQPVERRLRVQALRHLLQRYLALRVQDQLRRPP